MVGGLHPEAVRVTAREARRGRSLVDRAAARSPRLLIAFLRLLLRLPGGLGNRLLRDGHARGYAAYNRRDWEVNTAAIDRAIVFRAGDPAGAPAGIPSVAHGIDGYLEANLSLIAEFDGLRVQMRDFERIDRDHAVMTLLFRGTGKASGVPIKQEALIWHEFAAGKLVAQTFWWDLESGRTALGMRTPSARR